MERKTNYKVNWTTIYSLGLVPLIVVWGLAPAIGKLETVFVLVLAGFLWERFSPRLIQYPQGCGIIAWATGWSMMLCGTVQAGCLLVGWSHIPIILFLAPAISLLLYLFKTQKKKVSFCDLCIAQRGGAQERIFLGDFSRNEVQYIVNMITSGGILVTVITWALFLYGIKQDSRAGLYFYYYFPLGLTLAIILFETIRRILIQVLIESHDKRSRQAIDENEREEICYTILRVIVICQGEIYLIESNEKSPTCVEDTPEFDTPIQEYKKYSYTLDEEKQLARDMVRQKLGIENPDLRHFSSTTSPSHLRRMGQYLLFLPAEEKSKLDSSKGNWCSVETLNQLYRDNKLYPVFKEFYARLYTILNTARTYCMNGKRRVPIKGYKPTFTLLDIEKLDIEFDDPIWLYVSRHNEDKLFYRLLKKLYKLFHKKHRHD